MSAGFGFIGFQSLGGGVSSSRYTRLEIRSSATTPTYDPEDPM
jgi:hypothetical protein